VYVQHSEARQGLYNCCLHHHLHNLLRRHRRNSHHHRLLLLPHCLPIQILPFLRYPMCLQVLPVHPGLYPLLHHLFVFLPFRHCSFDYILNYDPSFHHLQSILHQRLLPALLCLNLRRHRLPILCWLDPGHLFLYL